MKKRLFDLALAIPALIFLAPVIVVLILLLRISVGKGVFFYQNRPGLHGKPFRISKFRTMTNDCDIDDCLLPDSKRLTKLGSFLRTTSLDELPEFFNVIRGDMSIVGPRPLLMQYLDRYTPEQARRHEVKPGITPVKWLSPQLNRKDKNIQRGKDFTGQAGWPRVNGRNANSVCSFGFEMVI